MAFPGLLLRFSHASMFTFLIVFVCLLVISPASSLGDPDVHLLQYDGPITPVASEFIIGGIETATEQNGGILILQLDTPGGLDTSMREIIKAILGSEIPVVVHVAPAGSRAASAGAFITVAAHVATMAPGTNIGSASPVQMMGAGMDSTMAHKVTNDAAAYMASIAEQRGRNVRVARSFVTEAANITAEEALTEGVIDLVAESLEELLIALDGHAVEIDGQEQELATSEGALVHHHMSARLKFLKRLVNPNLAYLLFLLGVYGLFFELSNPGSLVPGIMGAISILLALYAFHALPVDYSGVGLILLGVILLIMEVKIPSFGALTVGGLTALILGSMMLFNSAEQWAQVSLKVIIPAVTVFAGFFVLCIGLVVRAQKRRVVTGLEAMVGQEGRVIKPIEGCDNPGKAVIHGEIWNAVAMEPTHTIEVEARVVVLEVKGRVVRVKQVRPPHSEGE